MPAVEPASTPLQFVAPARQYAEAVLSVSVIVPSYNHAAFLRECIDSVLLQQPPPLQLIVVDDGSTDGSVELLRSYGPAITLLQQTRGRQARARNAALAVAQGDLVALLDSDDRYRPGRLEAALLAFQQDPDVTLTWSDYCTINAEGQPLQEQRWRQSPGADFRRSLIAGNPICNATVTVKRAALVAMGGFDERYPRACDGAAWYQLAASGHRLVHLQHVGVDYRMHAHNDGRLSFTAMAHERDAALRDAVAAYIQHGVIATRADLVWLRQALMRQFAFGAAADVQRRLVPGLAGRSTAAVLEALGSEGGLRGFAALKRIKDAWTSRIGVVA